MPNHPNRGWRRRMQDAADHWLTRWDWRTGGARMITDDQLRALLRDGYIAGYEESHTARVAGKQKQGEQND